MTTSVELPLLAFFGLQWPGRGCQFPWFRASRSTMRATTTQEEKSRYQQRVPWQFATPFQPAETFAQL
jgi:hypothetical protein